VPAEAVVRWALVAAVVLVLLAAGFVCLRAFGELRRILRRVGAYGELPVVGALTKAEADVVRIQTALDAVDPLLFRAQVAIATIRRGPQFSGFLGRLIGELIAFQAATRR
jgi:hypothetical protein